MSKSVRNEKNRLRLAILKQRADYRAFWDECGEKMTKAVEQCFDLGEFSRTREYLRFSMDCTEKLRRFNIVNPFPLAGGVRGEMLAALAALNPYDEKMPKQIPFKFLDDKAAIWQVVRHKPGDPWEPCEHSSFCFSRDEPVRLNPSERLLKVDLSRKKSELIAEFATFLDRVEYSRDTFLCNEPEGDEDELAGFTDDMRDNYRQWEQDNSRYRNECWKHLEIWKMRRQRKSFSTIASELKMKIPAAKKGFAHAFELIEGRKYDPVSFKQYKEMHKSELKRTCNDCPERPTCTELCPDALQYSEQEHAAQQHLLPNKPLLS